jgi:hypothetical protein
MSYSSNLSLIGVLPIMIDRIECLDPEKVINIPYSDVTKEDILKVT